MTGINQSEWQTQASAAAATLHPAALLLHQRVAGRRCARAVGALVSECHRDHQLGARLEIALEQLEVLPVGDAQAQADGLELLLRGEPERGPARRVLHRDAAEE